MSETITTTDPITDLHESLLRQMIVHSIGITKDRAGTLSIHADAAVNAWWAHRLLKALARVVPADELSALLADISDELEMGRAHGASWKAAAAIGIDVDALMANAEATFAARSASQEG